MQIILRIIEQFLEVIVLSTFTNWIDLTVNDGITNWIDLTVKDGIFDVNRIGVNALWGEQPKPPQFSNNHNFPKIDPKDKN